MFADICFILIHGAGDFIVFSTRKRHSVLWIIKIKLTGMM